MSPGARRRRLDRGASDPAPGADPGRVEPRRENGFLGLVRGVRRSRRARRRLLGVAAALVVVALMVALAFWARYRITHVISRNALVKGYITNVGAQLDGVVTSVEVESGQRVHAGQVIARFEDHQLAANVRRAESRLEKSTRELTVERLAIDQEQRRLSGRVTEASARVAAAGAQLEAARSQADDARERYELRKTLAERGMISPEELRTVETAWRTAEALAGTADADRVAAQAAKQLAEVEAEGLSVRRRGIEVLEAEIAGYRAELALAQADLDAARIRAPGDGWVVRRIAEAGASVVVGQPIVGLWIGKEVWVEAWIGEDDLSHVAPGCRAQVRVKSYPNRIYAGVVDAVGVSTDYELPDAAVPQPRNVRIRTSPVINVRIRLDESDGLVPGLSAEAGIRKKSGP